jgi:hypothetical protein
MGKFNPQNPAVTVPTFKEKSKYNPNKIISCFFPCPCGGMVPNAPPNCIGRKRWTEKANVFCVDILICDKCPMEITCSAVKKYNDLRPFKKRHRRGSIGQEEEYTEREIQEEQKPSKWNRKS